MTVISLTFAEYQTIRDALAMSAGDIKARGGDSEFTALQPYYSPYGLTLGITNAQTVLSNARWRTEDERAVLDEIIVERQRQDEKWGEQNHPDVDQVLMTRPGGCTEQRMAEEYEIPTADRAKFLCDNAATKGETTWGHILVEEVSEAIEAATQESTQLLREELIQVATVAVAWVEAIDRRSS